jgi:hypothetical protein
MGADSMTSGGNAHGSASRSGLTIWQIESKLREIDQTLRLAEVRCIPFGDLLRRLEHLWDDPAAGEIIYHVCQEMYSGNELAALTESIRHLIEAADCLSSPEKTRALNAEKQERLMRYDEFYLECQRILPLQ